MTGPRLSEQAEDGFVDYLRRELPHLAPRRGIALDLCAVPLGDSTVGETLDESAALRRKVECLTAEVAEVRAQAARDVATARRRPIDRVDVDPSAPAAAVRAGASSTERAAALAHAPRAGTQRAKLLEWISSAGVVLSGFTDDEAARALGRNPARLASRRKELLDGGWVEPVLATDPQAPSDGTGTYEGLLVKTRITRQGTPAVVWRRIPNHRRTRPTETD